MFVHVIANTNLPAINITREFSRLKILVKACSAVLIDESEADMKAPV